MQPQRGSKAAEKGFLPSALRSTDWPVQPQARHTARGNSGAIMISVYF